MRSRGETIGVFCMPVLPNFYVSHQWLRELRRRGRPPLVAVDFVVGDDEGVLVGHYDRAHHEMTAVRATALIMHAEDPLGYEVILPRGVASVEIVGTRPVPQVIGWRYSPEARDRRPCPCPVCQRGNIGASKVRARYGHLYDL
jgi:hypothetical protein